MENTNIALWFHNVGHVKGRRYQCSPNVSTTSQALTYKTRLWLKDRDFEIALSDIVLCDIRENESGLVHK